MEQGKERKADALEAASTKESIERHPSSVPSPDSKENDHQAIIYPSIGRHILILFAAALSVFLVALDTSIVSTAIPQITDDFHSLDDVAW